MKKAAVVFLTIVSVNTLYPMIARLSSRVPKSPCTNLRPVIPNGRGSLSTVTQNRSFSNQSLPGSKSASSMRLAVTHYNYSVSSERFARMCSSSPEHILDKVKAEERLREARCRQADIAQMYKIAQAINKGKFNPGILRGLDDLDTTYNNIREIDFLLSEAKRLNSSPAFAERCDRILKDIELKNKSKEQKQVEQLNEEIKGRKEIEITRITCIGGVVIMLIILLSGDESGGDEE